MNEENSQRQKSIDFLKVIAISLILIFHTIYEINQDNSLRYIGFIGISLFFIISGFLLAKNHPQVEKLSLNFFLSRYTKIAPLYYLALIMVVISFSKNIFSVHILKNLFYHFIFIDFISQETAYSLISPAWFLVPLITLYILFPYLNKLMKKLPPLLLAIFVLVIFFRASSGNYTSFSPIFFLGEFCFGILAAHQKWHPFMLASALIFLVMPIMIVPFLIFYSIVLLDFSLLPKRLASFISLNTLPIFLFHEAYIKVAFQKWKVFALKPIAGIFVLTALVIITIFLSKKLERKLKIKLLKQNKK